MVPRRVILALGLAAAAPLLTAASLDLAIGKRLFERVWVSAPSSTKSNDGLGPLYDAASCASCHVQNASDGRGETSMSPGMIIRLGNGRGTGDPVYGAQLSTRSVAGQIPEAAPDVEWVEKNGPREAKITLNQLGYGALAKDTRVSLRRAPSLKGVGLLAQVTDSEILSHADTEDSNRDGIAGRAAWIYVDGHRALGRFGWRATQPNLKAQIAAAFSRDMGLSTRLQPAPYGDCTPAERACRAGPHGAKEEEAEISDPILDMVANYVASLSPSSPVKDTIGQKLFEQTGCAACHMTLHLADGTPVPAYTDLLLHDMGAGLSDGIEEGGADPWFWRTAPLWNIADSLKSGGLLHDGRARNVTEAIEWHEGEASSAGMRFRALSPSDKAALVAFVSRL